MVLEMLIRYANPCVFAVINIDLCWILKLPLPYCLDVLINRTGMASHVGIILEKTTILAHYRQCVVVFSIFVKLRLILDSEDCLFTHSTLFTHSISFDFVSSVEKHFCQMAGIQELLINAQGSRMRLTN